ncbi:NAD(P)-binding protein [Neurospora crassa]|uniref:Alcohol dehydrogenase, variant n=1 Tax=Neurospora crassa (strain ATCC 24698 / 74-OR23-1A / CBS 708.71 / DSM 1257 / FGSC 987) TaxID=367110 RepID=V5IPE7_NEUCR|nr:alcohol dehydrogenase, variant [Neurospora crassa OR74A]ESA43054.1 alcohol dehydrogenase, variant [Neurospora crassa OR74A]KHE80960.1 NAD(P)-binding protein [Neurospora crassa]|eukprot:XP_011394224.1 alcohol dehydrogenase, variant [Neurospora crassa OR74A]
MPLQLTVKKIDGKPGQVYYPLQLNTIPKPTPGPGELLIRLRSCALNHRDLFIRQHLYPGISFEQPFLADGYGVVESTGPSVSPAASQLVGKPVLITPSRGWISSPDGPDDPNQPWTVIGSSQLTDAGTGQEYIVVPEAEAVPAPEHLSAAEGAALPLVGLTGWRALVTKAQAKPGQNILVTGIGGGVALQMLQFAVAMGCNVFVTSGNAEKIEKAKKMGAKGGVIYKDKDWDKQLMKQLPKDRPYLDAVVDGAGGDVVARSVKLLKSGGVISSYGMTVSPKMDWLMQAVLKNVELKGSTMGSRKEFEDMVAFVREKGIRPVVSKVVKGLDNLEGIDELFEEMKEGKQFGKLVVLIDGKEDQDKSKL